MNEQNASIAEPKNEAVLDYYGLCPLGNDNRLLRYDNLDCREVAANPADGVTSD